MSSLIWMVNNAMTASRRTAVLQKSLCQLLIKVNVCFNIYKIFLLIYLQSPAASIMNIAAGYRAGASGYRLTNGGTLKAKLSRPVPKIEKNAGLIKADEVKLRRKQVNERAYSSSKNVEQLQTFLQLAVRISGKKKSETHKVSPLSNIFNDD